MSTKAKRNWIAILYSAFTGILVGVMGVNMGGHWWSVGILVAFLLFSAFRQFLRINMRVIGEIIQNSEKEINLKLAPSERAKGYRIVFSEMGKTFVEAGK